MSPRRFTSKTFAFVFNDKQLNRPGRFETVRNRLTVLTVREDGSSGRFPRRIHSGTLPTPIRFWDFGDRAAVLVTFPGLSPEAVLE